MMVNIHCWLEESDTLIRCGSCGAVMPRPKEESTLHVSCTRCGDLLYNEVVLFQKTVDDICSIYDKTNVMYDFVVESVKYFLRRYKYLHESTKALSSAFSAISDEVLGPDYYIVDPIDGISAVEVMTKDILKNVRHKKRKSLFRRLNRK